MLCAKGGFEPQSETVWRQADKYRVPRIAFVNKMDVIGANFYNAVDMMKTRLKANAVPIELPIGKEDTFVGIIDLIDEDAVIYDNDLGTQFHTAEIPDDMKEEASEARQTLIEALADTDDDIAEKFLMEEEITVDEIKAALRRATIGMKITPVMCGSAYRNKGVQNLLNAIIDYLPSPIDIPSIEGTTLDGQPELRHSSDDEPFSALLFKVMSDKFVGKLAFVRIYSGVLTTGSYIMNSSKGKKERVGRIVRMHANERQDINEAYAGDIVAIVGLKESTTGNSLCDPDHPVILEDMEFPDPVINVAIEPKTKAGQEKWA